MRTSSVGITQIETAVYRVRTDFPESHGTLEWDSTTLVVVRAGAGNETGIGYTFTDRATADLIRDLLAKVVKDRDAMAVTGCWTEMMARVRNLGKQGIAAMAISAVDSALWDLKARLLGLPLVTLLGAVRDSVPIYGSGGFTSYSDTQLEAQLAGWVAAGIPRVKMKVGRDGRADLRRVRVARKAIGADTELFVDANGAYSRKQALAQAQEFADMQVTWFEEPVSSDDLDGPALAARPRSCRDGDRGRRVWIRSWILSENAGSRCGRCTASGRHSLRGDYRLLEGSSLMRSQPGTHVGPHCPLVTHSGWLCNRSVASRRIFPRSRSD